ncbi:MAG: cupin [Candidatus Marinimicrobia bacterium]|nr:cupin [Candidatus Neomarinimicrobiota bacterium]|tara:strand:+ start:116 stop:475 length:360 start_codon:yes stop_codon:yes gene_type:complete
MLKRIKKPTIIDSVGTKPKKIEEFIGRVNTGTERISIARMTSTKGWEEPGQIPEFEEYTVILKGEMKVETEKEVLSIKEGEAVIAEKGKWVRYSTPQTDTQYIAICLPAFSPDSVHRDK